MSTKPHKSATQIDADLAEFIDRILSDQPVEESEVEELQVLEYVVSRLKAVAKNPPAEATLHRIEKQLVKEWNESRDFVEKKPSIWRSLLLTIQSLGSQLQRQPALALVLVIFILIAIIPVAQIFTSGIQASAGGDNQYQVVLFIAAVILVLGLLWFGRGKS